MNASEIRMLLNSSAAPELVLREHPPLALTTNFAWVVGACTAAVLSVPLLLAWTTTLLL
jgi:hypothetical protein